nr:hypothetical protein Itr_chr14CG07050 [Ipomoea trifida]
MRREYWGQRLAAELFLKQRCRGIIIVSEFIDDEAAVLRSHGGFGDEIIHVQHGRIAGKFKRWIRAAAAVVIIRQCSFRDVGGLRIRIRIHEVRINGGEINVGGGAISPAGGAGGGGGRTSSGSAGVIVVGGGDPKHPSSAMIGDNANRRGLGSPGLPAAAADGNVAERTPFGPVPPTTFAEVPRLGQTVIVVVTKLGIHGTATRTRRRNLNVRLPCRRRSLHHHRKP